jgi:hypothetical protein
LPFKNKYINFIFIFVCEWLFILPSTHARDFFCISTKWKRKWKLWISFLWFNYHQSDNATQLLSYGSISSSLWKLPEFHTNCNENRSRFKWNSFSHSFNSIFPCNACLTFSALPAYFININIFNKNLFLQLMRRGNIF